LNRRVLIGIMIAIVGIALIGLGILAINRVLKQSFAPPAQPTPVVEATTDILVTTRDLAVGTVLNREDVQIANVPVTLAPRDALQTVESALGKLVTVHLVQGEMLLQHHLADPTNVSHDIGYTIADDQVLMAFPASDLMSTLGVLQRGDNVDIFASLTVEISPTNTTGVTGTGEEQTVPKLFTFDALQRIQISAIVADVVTQSSSSSNSVLPGQAQPTPNPTDVKVRAYLLALNAQDALVLKNMRDAGAIFDIVLRSPTSSELFEVSPVTEEYLMQRYKLQLPR
jgi:Flp pilus assembly protein CpaB